ncbi:MAG: NAD-dependent epimerase/dehydratase family protein [Thermogemmata sp.]|nr:NAD-dependent epimerase/dehydratase family protein [Thermogemmata sp.]
MKVLVTGGGGFLGGAIVRLLCQRGMTVRSFTRSHYPWLDELGVEQALGDLADAPAVARAVQGCELVIHTAAKAGVWGRPADFYATNVLGTRNVLEACRRHGVPRLIYTSTPSVVYAGRDIINGDESLPYPSRYTADYPRTKAEAERAVLAANSPELATVALRPHLIFGPGDPHLLPRILERARQGRLRRIGRRSVFVDVTYLDNAAYAHLDAADRLHPQAPCAGKAYFITNGQPVDLWDFINRILTLAQLPPVQKTVPAWWARTLGSLCEWLYWLLRIPDEPPMTRFIAEQLSTSHYFSIAAAQRDLGYYPRVPLEEGLQRLSHHLRPSTGA